MIDLVGISVAGGALILTVLILKLVFGSKVPPRAWVMMWTVILLRLLLPVRFDIGMQLVADRMILNSILKLYQASAIPANRDGTGIPGMTGLMLIYVWCIIAAVLFAVVIILYIKTMHSLRGAREYDSETIAYWVHKCMKTVGIKKTIRIYMTDKFGGACVIGILRPILVLPLSFEKDHPDEVKENVIFHEMQHIRNKDNAQRLMSLLAVCMHWFNPFVWYAYLSYRTDMESVCDEAVCKKLPESRIEGYGATIIRIAAFFHRWTLSAVCSGISMNRNILRHRIQNITLLGRRKLLWMTVSVIFIVMIAAYGTLTFFIGTEESAYYIDADIVRSEDMISIYTYSPHMILSKVDHLISDEETSPFGYQGKLLLAKADYWIVTTKVAVMKSSITITQEGVINSVEASFERP